jgi:hypothetical protein
MGNRELPTAAWSDDARIIQLFQLHQEHLNAAIEALLAERAVQEAAETASTDDRDAMPRLEEAVCARARREQFWLWDTRGRIRRAGLTPPDLPPALAHIDVNFHPPQLVDPPLGVGE